MSLLKVALETGRTHQIRVHMQHIGLPLVGDPVYAPKRPPQRSNKVSSKLSDVMYQQLMDFSRQALHARRLQLQHPVTGVPLDVTAPMPSDLQDLLSGLDFAVLDGDMQVGEQE